MIDTFDQPAVPVDADVERQVLGAMLFGETARAFLLDEAAVHPDDFYVDVHRVLLLAIRDLASNGRPVDPSTVVDAAGRHPEWADGTAVDLRALRACAQDIGATYAGANGAHHAELLRDLAERRRLLAASWATIADVQDRQRPAHEVRALAEQRLIDTTGAAGGAEITTAPDAIRAAVDVWDKPSTFRGLSTGFADLDDALKGMKAGQLIIVGARPSMGKSAFGLDLARHSAFRQGAPTLLFSMEMTDEEIAGRLAASEASIPQDRLTGGRATDADFRKVATVADQPNGGKLMWTDRVDLSIEDIASVCRRSAARLPHGLGLVVVDYIGLIRATNPRDLSRNNQVSHISRGLKVLARSLGCPIVALSQLSRANESRVNKRPMLSDLRDSGSLEQDANVVLFLHREDYYDETAPPGVADLIVAKNRGGRLGDVKLLLEASYPRFVPGPRASQSQPPAPRLPVPLPEIQR
jgi:replicative DNA helicase